MSLLSKTLLKSVVGACTFCVFCPGAMLQPIFCGLLRENTRVFKLSKELVALVHAFGVCLFSALKSLLHDLF